LHGVATIAAKVAGGSALWMRSGAGSLSGLLASDELLADKL
jgi:hypothetical protein